MNILTFNSENELHETAAGIITGIVQTKPSAVLGLATGGTPVGIYEQMVKTYKRGLVSFRKVTTFNLDEYVGLPQDHPESYRHYMNTHLFNHIDIPADQAHIPNGDSAADCLYYDVLIEQAGQFDMQILGLGHNGHIGFNEPAHALLAATHIVELAPETRAANARYFSTVDEVPSRAITMGVGTILKARMIILVVKGEDKARMVSRALKGPISTDCPASLLQTHPNLTVLLDRAAGQYL